MKWNRSLNTTNGLLAQPMIVHYFQSLLSSSSSALQPWVGLGLRLRFHNNIFFFLQGEVVSLMPNPQPGGPEYPFLSGSSPLTCLAWEALPVAYAITSIALGIIWPHKPRHYAKVGIPSGGQSLLYIYFLQKGTIPRRRSLAW